MAGAEFSGTVVGGCGNWLVVATRAAINRMDTKHPRECAAGVGNGNDTAANYIAGIVVNDMVGNPPRRGIGKRQSVGGIQ